MAKKTHLFQKESSMKTMNGCHVNKTTEKIANKGIGSMHN